MSQSFAALLRSLLYRVRYRGARIGPGCFIRSDSMIAADAEIGLGTCIAGGRLCPHTKLGVLNVIEAYANVGNSQFGEYCTIQEGTRVFDTSLESNITIQPGCLIDQVNLGAWSYIARDTILNNVRLGRFCSIGPRTIIGTGEHPVDLISTSPVFYSTRGQCGPGFATQTTFEERRAVNIGHDVWIGAHVFVRDGVNIGNGAIVAAGAAVTKDVPAYAIVGGTPAKLIRSRFSSEVITRLETLAWFNWDRTRLAQAQPYIAQNNPEAFLSWAEAHSAP